MGSRPSIGSGPGANRPAIGSRPSQLPSTGAGQRPGIGAGQRPGIGSGARPGTLPALGAGAAIGAGLANRPGTLPGLGGERPGRDRPSSPQERRDNLQNRVQDARDRTDRQDRRDERGEGRTDRRDDRQEGRTDRQEGRTDRRDDRQELRNERREDWQDWRDDNYGHYGDWYNGCWSGNYGDWWDHMWDEHPLAATLGVTRWGLNRLGYWYGFPWYDSWYQNPYYEAGATTGYDYSQPIVLAPEQAAAVEAAPADAPLPPTATQPGVDKFDQARAAFYEGKYEQALKLTDEALKEMPKDAVLHEFRSLVLFALKRYTESAAAIHAVMAAGPGWDWTTMSSLYPSSDAYTAQLRALEDYRDSHSKDAGVRLLLGYHYLTTGYPKEAADQFRRVTELQPKDTVAAELYRMLSPSEKKAAAKTDPAKPAPSDPAKTIPQEKVVGAWTASGKGNAKYAMTLTKDGNFTWSYTSGSKKQEVKGVYALDGSSLAMEPAGGGVMLAELAVKDANSLHFQPVGAPANDPGLQFKRDSQ